MKPRNSDQTEDELYHSRKLSKPIGTNLNWDFPTTVSRDLKLITIEHPNYNTLDLVDQRKLKTSSISVLQTLQRFLEEDEGDVETDLDCFSILDELEENSPHGSPKTHSPLIQQVNSKKSSTSNIKFSSSKTTEMSLSFRKIVHHNTINKFHPQRTNLQRKPSWH